MRRRHPRTGSPDALRPASKSERGAGGASAASAPGLCAHPPYSTIQPRGAAPRGARRRLVRRVLRRRRPLVGPLGRWGRRYEQEGAFDDGGSDGGELAAVVLGVVAQHLEGAVGIDRMAGHQDALCLLDQRATAERALQAVVLGEPLQGDVDRALELFRGGVDDVGEDAAPRARGRPARGGAWVLVRGATRWGGDVDRALELFRGGVDDVGEDAALG